MADLKMPDINTIIIAGNLTSDPILRTTTNGTSVANFPIAYSRKFKDNSGNWREDACYVGVVAWYKLAESCYENLMKGSAVMVEGELKSKSWKTENGYKNIVEIKAKRIQFLNKKPNIVVIDENGTEDDTGSFNNAVDDSLPLSASQTEGNSSNSDTLNEPPDSDKHKESDENYMDYDKLTL